VLYLLFKKQVLRLNAYKEEVNLFLMLYEEGMMEKMFFTDFSWDNGKLIGCLKMTALHATHIAGGSVKKHPKFFY
jgi:hypothetical protein